MRTIDYRTLTAGLDTNYDILCLDTEFTRLPLDKEAVWIWAEQAQILSVALASLNDQLLPSQLYVTRTIDAEIRRKCTPFVLSDVLPHMSAAMANSIAGNDGDIGAALKLFLRKRQLATGLPQLLAVDWIGDAYLINALLDESGDWLLLDSVPEIEYALGDGFPTGKARHNALHDVGALRTGLQRWFEGRQPPAPFNV